ncbi:hypothetical protein [Pseudomonas sivasensis]|uniref:hypothetical protein n=1 Tax=Pseudomonas sivasensis TaxID=1880678 RepID=UPI0030D6CE71
MRLELYNFDAKLPDGVLLALAITGNLDDDGQRHTGFVVRDFFDNSQLFHLGRNNYYRQEVLSKSYSYLLVPALEPEVANAVISLLVTVLQNTHGNVPYSIAWDQEEYFDSDGRLVKTDPIDGFTCATFVLEILKRQGMELVDRSTWPLSDENKNWQKNILPLLGLSIESLMAQLEAIGKFPRIRPEEALGAGHLFRGDPLPFNVVQPVSRNVLDEMKRLRQMPPAA